MAEHLQQTLTELNALAVDHACVAVGFSGGKDSLATLDLAVKCFKTVCPYYYFMVPGLKHEESKTHIAATRYGLTVRMYPSVEGIDALRIGLYCDESAELSAMPPIDRRTLYNWIKADTGATLLLTGEKLSDGPFRTRRMSSQKKTMADVMYPLKHWRKWEVISYLSANGIAIPDAGRGDNGGFSLMEPEILWAYDHHREDYETMRKYFPYIETVILHRAWFGQQ
jgi:phosphoadenosine phosphosulfate reductase